MSANRRIYVLLLSGLLVGVLGNVCGAQDNVYHVNVVGYVNTTFGPGFTLFENPLDNQPGNQLIALIPTAPERTTVSLWNSATASWSPTATFSAGAWDTNLYLPPGRGAMLYSPASAPFVNTFVGEVLAPDGSPFEVNGTTMPLALEFTGPAGKYALGCKCPIVLGPASPDGLSVFPYVVGRDPLEGEQFILWDTATQTYVPTTFLSGAWDNGEPALSYGQAALFQLTPEPATRTLLALGGMALLRRRR